jgi:hypothetical protein
MLASGGTNQRYIFRGQIDRQPKATQAEREMYSLWLKNTSNRIKRTKSDRLSLRWLRKGTNEK